MFTLFVSHNCGTSYFPERTAETIDELRPRLEELDSQLIRWYLGKDGKDYWGEACAIHKGIISFMEAVNNPEDDPAHLDKLGSTEDIELRLQYEEAKA